MKYLIEKFLNENTFTNKKQRSEVQVVVGKNNLKKGRVKRNKGLVNVKVKQ